MTENQKVLDIAENFLDQMLKADRDGDNPE